MRLTGSYLQTMDDRLRLAVPSKLLPVLRDLAGAKGDDPIEVVISVTMRVRVGIFPKPVFESMLDGVLNANTKGNTVSALSTTYFNTMEYQTLDKQNRFRLPQSLSDIFDLAGEVVVLGSGDHLEVVNKANWKQQLLAQMPQMAQLHEQILNAKGGAA